MLFEACRLPSSWLGLQGLLPDEMQTRSRPDNKSGQGANGIFSVCGECVYRGRTKDLFVCSWSQRNKKKIPGIIERNPRLFLTSQKDQAVRCEHWSRRNARKDYQHSFSAHATGCAAPDVQDVPLPTRPATPSLPLCATLAAARQNVGRHRPRVQLSALRCRQGAVARNASTTSGCSREMGEGG